MGYRRSTADGATARFGVTLLGVGFTVAETGRLRPAQLMPGRHTLLVTKGALQGPLRPPPVRGPESAIGPQRLATRDGS